MWKPTNSSLEEKEEAINALIVLVGERVRAARKDAGISRRELTLLSGVSQRYLAQLESGEGNISIGLLKRIAIAFERPLESFIIDDDELSIEANQMATLYRQADASTRSRVQHVLNPQQRLQNKAQRICLIGLRGAGKSALGARIGKEFGVKFFELNHQIEQAAGMPIAEVIALYGQEGYRELEASSLSNIIDTQNQIILAVAGGVVSDNETFTKLLSRFNTVWVKASPDEHMERVRAQGDMRPMADNPQAMVQLRQILKNREAQYKQADFQLDTTAKSLDQSHVELSELIKAEALIKP